MKNSVLRPVKRLDLSPFDCLRTLRSSTPWLRPFLFTSGNIPYASELSPSPASVDKKRDIFSFSQLRKSDKRGCVEEVSYRQSRLCWLLGNPVAFTVVQLLAENRQMNPSEIATQERVADQ